MTANDRTFGPKWISDLDIAYDVSSRTTVGVGADNLFDIYPSKIGIVATTTGGGLYGNLSPYGITGGFYYARLTQKF